MSSESKSNIDVVEKSESSTSSNIPVPDDKRRSSNSSDSYGSDTTGSFEDDRISTNGYDEDGRATGPMYKGTSLSRHVTGMSARTGISIATTSDPNFEVDFEESDPADPHNWPLWYRCAVIGLISYSCLAVIMYSTSYTAAIPGIMSTFNISSTTVPVLGLTTYMCGLAIGSIVLAPLSEMYGRRPVYLIAMTLFIILVIPCALAQNLEAILITRFFGAICGSALITNSAGTVNDVVLDEHRALAFSVWSLGPMNGPAIGPVICGFIAQYMGWRATNWLVCIMSGVALVCLFLIKETYAPAILRKMAAKRRKETDDPRWWSRYDDKQPLIPLLLVNLKRPLSMAVKEPICIFWNIYIALLYAIMYMCFVAYPIVFRDLRGWSQGMSGLSYLGLGAGTILCIACEPLIRRMINSHEPDPETGKPPPEAGMSIICIASICVPVGELIFAWTCTPNVHYIVPILASVPFGFGNTCVFIYSANYLVHSYGIYAASSLAGNGVARSLMGGTLPLAGPAMYRTLGPNWAGTLLALLEFACIPIPFVFYRYGHKIRMKSALIRQMQEDKDKLESKKRKNEEKASAANENKEKSNTAVMAEDYGAELEKAISRASNRLVV